MVVRSDQSILGTIGGGRLEADVIRAAAAVFEKARTQILTFELQGSLGSGVDMICGGRMEILLGYVEADARNLELFQTLRKAVKGRRQCLLVTALGSSGEGPEQLRLSLVLGEESVPADFPYPASWLSVLNAQAAGQRSPIIAVVQDHRFLVEPCVLPPTVFLFGAGHVSQQVAALTRRVGLHTVVLDDRAEYANQERFPGADDIIVLASFENAFQDIEIGADSYLVIVTRGHSHDRTVLAQALGSRAGYIGMMGSRRKRDTIYESLIREGFQREDLQRVRCPIGLEIGAESPEEIAVSIVAELILVRSEAGVQ